jgi:CRP/FNR family cyclic AMP-dependent transcriptional regulator
MAGRVVVNGIKVEEAITDFLIHFPFFDRLSKDELDLVANHIHIIELDPGDVLFEEGDKGDSIFFIVEGELDVIKEPRCRNDWGIDHVVITKLSKGRTIGEMSVIDKIPRSATVKAAKRSTLVTLTDRGFDMVLKDYPQIGVKILKGIAQLLSLNMRKTSSLLVDSLIPIL